VPEYRGVTRQNLEDDGAGTGTGRAGVTLDAVSELESPPRIARVESFGASDSRTAIDLWQRVDSGAQRSLRVSER